MYNVGNIEGLLFIIMIKRTRFLEDIIQAFQVTPVCALIGPRQCGKTTVAKEMAEHFSGKVHYFDLEDERDQNKMREPLLVLENLTRQQVT